MHIRKIFIPLERLKRCVNVILTLCGCSPDKRHRTTARLSVLVPGFWQMPVKISSIDYKPKKRAVIPPDSHKIYTAK